MNWRKRNYRICIWCGKEWNVSVKYPAEHEYICPVCKYGYNWLKKICRGCKGGKVLYRD